MSIFVVTKVGNKYIVGDNSTKYGNGVAEGKTVGAKFLRFWEALRMFWSWEKLLSLVYSIIHDFFAKINTF